MRPLRLDLHGFTVFRDPTTVDFTDADFFALVGPTGSGKSTVLDAVCFALYGTVPRWNDRRAVSNALAPSAATARVRLVFESAGARYVATRVLRRDGKGKVTTAQAGLELLPRGFDLSTLDGELAELGEPLAGTPAEMEQAVLDAVGLPYEQFTTCVLLPQGDFAEFLHAKPAVRGQILVNLLGLSVYERIREQAASLAAVADAQLAATGRLMDELADASPEALARAEQEVAAMRGLSARVESLLPDLGRAETAAEAAAQRVEAVRAEIARLREVRQPDGVAELSGAAVAARADLDAAAADLLMAEEREDKLRGALAAAGDPVTGRRLLDLYAERDGLVTTLSEVDAMVEVARAERAGAAEAVAAAQARAEAMATALEEARVGYQAAQAADRAAALRAHLREGEPCPVCEQRVATVPPMPPGSVVAEAEAAGKRARAEADRAAKVLAERTGTLGGLDRALAAAHAQRDQLAGRMAELDGRLSGAPGPAALREELAGVAAIQRDLESATAAVRTARERHRRCTAAQSRAQDRLSHAWQAFDGVRDSVAALGPPVARRDDLATAWSDLAGWAGAQIESRNAARATAVTAAEQAAEQVDRMHDALREEFVRAGAEAPGSAQAEPSRTRPSQAVPSPDAAGYARLAASALERALGRQSRLVERRDQAERLREQRAGHERDSRVAKALANHLRANNFERWLLAEALDRLVAGASRILRDLSAGQYELVHEKGEFFVIDHHDAALRRAVRTLSGGETFQASLSLALALSEQLTGLSTGNASLDSIILDEGFGTLDAASLDTVAATLESLAAKGDRMVGVVTHVPALAERIPVRFEVRKDSRTARVERTGL